MFWGVCGCKTDFFLEGVHRKDGTPKSSFAFERMYGLKNGLYIRIAKSRQTFYNHL